MIEWEIQLQTQCQGTKHNIAKIFLPQIRISTIYANEHLVKLITEVGSWGFTTWPLFAGLSAFYHDDPC